MGICASTPERGPETLPAALTNHFCGTVCCTVTKGPTACCAPCHRCRERYPFDAGALTPAALTHCLREGGALPPLAFGPLDGAALAVAAVEKRPLGEARTD